MGRALPVAALALGGCAAPRQEQKPVVACRTESDAELAELLRRYSRSDDWLENHPVLRGLAVIGNTSLIGFLLGVAASGR
jgi:hypothetical protein